MKKTLLGKNETGLGTTKANQPRKEPIGERWSQKERNCPRATTLSSNSHSANLPMAWFGQEGSTSFKNCSCQLYFWSTVSNMPDTLLGPHQKVRSSLEPRPGPVEYPADLGFRKTWKISSLYLVSTQISFASNMTQHLPREQGINKAGKHYKTSLRRLVAFRFLTLLLELVSSVFFSVFFSSMWMTRDIFDHLNFQSFESSPGSVRWKESKGAQPVVDGDNHHVFIHHHLWSETSAPVLKSF